MSRLRETLAAIDALDGLAWDERLLERLQSGRERRAGRPVRFHNPSFKAYSSPELPACDGVSWPAISITGPDCRLQCDHCRGKVLEPMIPARDPEAFVQAAEDAASRGAGGLLVTGGSNLDDEVEYGPFLPAFRRVKARFPDLRLAVHTGLMDGTAAAELAGSGIDIAMVDLVGARDTVRQVYHLRREPEDFEQTLAALQAAGLRTVPHIVVGLHYGHLLGEWRALEMLQRQRPDSAVLVVAMPHYAPAHRPFRVPAAEEVGTFLLDARAALPDTDLLLGCARPPGANRARLDAYAVMAGLDGVVQPAEGVVELAERLGRAVRVEASCCAAPAEVAVALPQRAGCG